MVSKTEIEKLINELITLYDDTSNVNHKIYYSKLALLELSGWLEDTHDVIIKSYGVSKITEDNNLKYLNSEIIKRTKGCTYDNHMRLMLIQLIGIINTEKLEATLKTSGKLDILITQLKNIWDLRNPLAHTSVAGIMPTYNSPSIILGYLNSIYPALSELDLQLKSI